MDRPAPTLAPPPSTPPPSTAPPAAARVTPPATRGEQRPEMTRPEAELSAPILLSLDKVTWTDGPASLPKGAKIAVLEGAPPFPANKTFTFLAKLPRNYTIAPHTHLATEHVTVLSGAFSFGHGETLDRASATKVLAGGAIFIPAGHAHYAFTTDKETTIALTGVGPWEIIYIDPKDDPRPTPARRPDNFVASEWDAPITATILQAKDVTFEDPPPGLMPPGIKMAVLEGDPNVAKTFTLRLQLSKGQKVPVHAHSYTERFMIIAGGVKFAVGDTWSDKQMQDMKAPSIGVLPKDVMHYARAQTPQTVVQISGVGPFDMKWANPADAPERP